MSQDTLNYLPQRVDIRCKAGDSVSFEVKLEEIDQIPDPFWTASVADEARAYVEDFMVTPTAEGAVFTLHPEQTRALSERENVLTQRIVGAPGTPALLWAGSYDVELSYDTSLARTLVRGAVEIYEDVTR